MAHNHAEWCAKFNAAKAGSFWKDESEGKTIWMLKLVNCILPACRKSEVEEMAKAYKLGGERRFDLDIPKE